MLSGILTTCLTFLIIFVLSLWPILLPESKHRKYYFIGVNILYFVILVYSYNGIVQIRRQSEEVEADLRKIVAISAEELTAHPEKIIAAASSANEKNDNGAPKYGAKTRLRIFLSELEENHKSADNTAARQGNGDVSGNEVKP